MNTVIAGAEDPGNEIHDGQLAKGTTPEQADAAQFETQIGRLMVATRGTLAWRITVGGLCMVLAETCPAKQYAAEIATACGKHPERTLRQYRAEACLYAQLIGQQRMSRAQIQADAKLVKKLELKQVTKQLAERRINTSQDLRAGVSQLPADPATLQTAPSPSAAAKKQRTQAMTERLLARYMMLPDNTAKAKCRERLFDLYAELSEASPAPTANQANSPQSSLPAASQPPKTQKEQKE